MKKLILLTLLSITSHLSNAQYVTIPDSNFVKFLQAEFPTAMSGNQMDTTANVITSVKTVNCDSNDIENLYGIQFFDSLQELKCFNNLITNILSLPNSLKILNCNDNLLVNLPSLPSTLIGLDCESNQLSNLPVLPDSLGWLHCNGNKLTNLPTLPNSLHYILCINNQITNLPKLPDDLIWLSCSRNKLTTLPTLPDSLYYLYADSNQLSSLPPFPNTLENISLVNNKLTSIPEFPEYVRVFKCMDNPQLECLPYFTQKYFALFAVEKNTKIKCLPHSIRSTFRYDNTRDLPVCDANSGCPSAMNIAGNVHQDTSSNCSLDSLNNGPLIEGIKMLGYVNGLLKWQTYTDKNGSYTLPTTNNKSVEIKIDDVYSSVGSCPTSGIRSISPTSDDTIYKNQDFGVKCQGVDLGVFSISGTFRPTRPRPVYIQAGDLSQKFNLSCGDNVSGTVTTTIIGSATYIAPLAGALNPTSITGDTLIYTIADFGAIDPDSAFNIIVKTDSNATVGSDVCIKTKVSTAASDINSINDSLLFCGEVVNSYDPNDKASYPKRVATPDTWITYTIRYQNTGTDTAYNVIIRDTLSTYLDESSFTYLTGSVRPVVNLVGPAISFNFRDINLLDSFSNEPESHGWVQYKVRTKSNLPPFAKIENTAFIYFDLNSAVVTNTTTNEYVIRSSKDITSCDSALVNGEFYFATQTIIDTIGPEVITTDLVINSVNSETISTGATILSNQADAQYQWLDCDSSFSSIDSETSQSFTATRNGEYAVEVSHNGCIDTSNCVTITTLSITENSLAEYFKIYPNPTKGNITIAFDENHSHIQARILSITGQEIARHTASNTNTIQFNFEAAKGIYFIEITTENGGKSVVRVVKE